NFCRWFIDESVVECGSKAGGGKVNALASSPRQNFSQECVGGRHRVSQLLLSLTLMRVSEFVGVGVSDTVTLTSPAQYLVAQVNVVSIHGITLSRQRITNF